MNLSKTEQIAVHYGLKPQLQQTIEECAELIQAINKYFRANDNEAEEKAIQKIVEETADVKIMLSQLEYLFDITDMVNQAQLYKIERTLQRIEKEKEGQKNG